MTREHILTHYQQRSSPKSIISSASDLRLSPRQQSLDQLSRLLVPYRVIKGLQSVFQFFFRRMPEPQTRLSSRRLPSFEHPSHRTTACTTKRYLPTAPPFRWHARFRSRRRFGGGLRVLRVDRAALRERDGSGGRDFLRLLTDVTSGPGTATPVERWVKPSDRWRQ